MQLAPSIQRGTLLKRYKRFLADVRLEDGTELTAHCANPGSMLGLTEPGSEVWLSRSDNPRRKLAYSLELIRVGDSLVCVNTQHANKVAAEAIEAGRISEISGYASMRREVKYGEGSRIDLLLEDPERPPCWVEIKSVTLLRTPGLAEFPDSVTTRGAKHLRELTRMVEKGERSVMLYLVQREDCEAFATADDIDPAYGSGLREAHASGVEAICYASRVRPDGISVERRIPFRV